MTAALSDARSEYAPSLHKGRGRDASIDVVRLIGILVVVCGHVWSDYPIGGYVAIFFVITGYLWSDRRTLMDEIKYRGRILLVPYLSWLVVVGGAFAIQRVAQGAAPWEIKNLVINYAKGGKYIWEPLTAYWFMTAIFSAGVIYKIISNSSAPIYWITVIIALFSTLIGPQLAYIPLAIGVGFCCIPFIAAGHMFKKYQAVIKYPLFLAICALIGSIAVIYSGGIDRMVLKHGYFGTPAWSILLGVLIACAAIVLAPYLVNIMPKKITKGVTSLVQLATPIILLHTVPLWLLPDEINRLLVFVVCLAFSAGVGFFLLRQPSESVIRTLLMPSR